MLYRPQSIFLIATIAVLCLVVLMPIWDTKAREPNLKLGREYHVDSNPFREYSHDAPVFIIPLLLALLARSLNLTAIFIAIYGLCKYNNRGFQLKLGLLNAYVLATLLGLALYLSIQRQKEIQLLMHCLLPAMALVGNLLANHYIRKDEKLVKVAERIR
jgi:hypothetical protein